METEAIREFTDNPGKQLIKTVYHIYLAIKNNATYPGNHPITIEFISKAFTDLSELLEVRPSLTVSVFGNKLFIEDKAIESDFRFSSQFADDLTKKSIDSITFYRGVSLSDFMNFLNIMIDPPNTLNLMGGVASIFKELGVSTIKFNNVKYGKLFKKDGLKGNETPGNDFVDESSNPGNFNNAIEPHESEGSTKTDKIINLVVPNYWKKDSVRRQFEYLLTDDKNEEAQAILQDICRKMQDPSRKVRRYAAESLSEISEVLNRFGMLGKNLQDITKALKEGVEKDDHIDVYLAANKSLDSISHLEKHAPRFILEETIGYRLYESNHLSKSSLKQALKARNQNGRALEYNLADLELIDEGTLVEHLAKQHKDCRTVVLSEIDHIPQGVLRAFPTKFIQRYRVLPFKYQSGSLLAATNKPNDLGALNDLRFISGYSVISHLATEYHLLKAIRNYYNIDLDHKNSLNTIENVSLDEDVEFIENERQIEYGEELDDSAAPVIRLVNLILKDAIAQKASDIHIEPFENELKVRFRIDGSLTTVLNPSVRFSRVIPSRIKVMSGLDISERRLPQDGRFRVRKDGTHVDFRVSVFPGLYGEKVVLRLLHSERSHLGVNKIGLDKDELNSISAAMCKSKGMILVTGPTGSGKTTTLYSILHDLNNGSKNISTIEDPIEYNLKGVNQFQMHTKIGLDFPRALRTLLRQDPDIIMVGEIRDAVTASIAMRAALTGHLVLSTLHTNSAPETITRLLDMKIEPFIINSCVHLVVAQRLMREVCPKCKTEYPPTDLQLMLLNEHGFDISNSTVFKGEGCENCNNTGYKGRIAIFEIMQLSEEIREIISKGQWSFISKAQLKDLGIVTLQEQGFNKLIQGLTSLEEWVRVVL